MLRIVFQESTGKGLTLGWSSPRAAVVSISEAINERAIIAAEKMPKELNKPIGEKAMMVNPATSDAAEPTSANAQAPPTPSSAVWWSPPSSRTSR